MKKQLLAVLVAGVLLGAGADAAMAAGKTPEETVTSALVSRSQALHTGNDQSLDAHYYGASQKLKAHEHKRIADVRKQLKANWPGKILSIKSNPKVISTDVTGEQATVKAYDEMEIVWVPFNDDHTATTVPKGANGEITSKVGTYHDVTLQQADGEWQIVTDSYDEGPEYTKSPDYVAPKAQAPAAPAPYQTSLEQAAAASVVNPEPLFNFTYDHQKAANYSNTYWSYYNPAYRNFNPVGGDCANFVSQSLRAGGQPDDGSWYYRYAGGSTADDGWTYAWVNNQGLRDWARNTMRGIAYSNYASLMVGDFINYDWNWDGTYDHVTIVVQAGTNCLINSHNSDRYHYPYNYGSSQGMQYTHLYTWP